MLERSSGNSGSKKYIGYSSSTSHLVTSDKGKQSYGLPVRNENESFNKDKRE